MLDRLYQVLGGKTDVVSEKAFADDAKIGDWARGSVYAMRQTGIMQGKENNRFCPTDGYTAEQSIVTIERMYQIIKYPAIPKRTSFLRSPFCLLITSHGNLGDDTVFDGDMQQVNHHFVPCVK